MKRMILVALGIIVLLLFIVATGLFVSEPLSPMDFDPVRFSTEETKFRKGTIESLRKLLSHIESRIKDYEMRGVFNSAKLNGFATILDSLEEAGFEMSVNNERLEMALGLCPSDKWIGENGDTNFERIKRGLYDLRIKWSPDIQFVRKGRKVYQRYCASCHGVNGDGDGVVYHEPQIAPRDLTGKSHVSHQVTFKFKSNSYGSLPADDDLYKTIRQGLAGTTMPAFDYLPSADSKAVVEYIKTFSYLEWKYKGVEEQIRIADIPAELFSSEWINAGRMLFSRSCMACHGDLENGKYSTEMKELQWSKDGKPIRAIPRDFTAEPLRRGRSVKDIYTTLYVGIGGTSMPSYSSLRDEELWQLVAYVRYLMSKAKSR